MNINTSYDIHAREKSLVQEAKRGLRANKVDFNFISSFDRIRPSIDDKIHFYLCKPAHTFACTVYGKSVVIFDTKAISDVDREMLERSFRSHVFENVTYFKVKYNNAKQDSTTLANATMQEFKTFAKQNIESLSKRPDGFVDDFLESIQYKKISSKNLDIEELKNTSSSAQHDSAKTLIMRGKEDKNIDNARERGQKQLKINYGSFYRSGNF